MTEHRQGALVGAQRPWSRPADPHRREPDAAVDKPGVSAEKPEVVGRVRRSDWRRAWSLPAIYRQILWMGPSARQVIALVALALLFFCVAGSIDYAAAQAMRLIMLETSSQPVTLDEAQRSHPKLGRPRWCVSFQNGTDAPWHHRTCAWSV